MHKKSKENQRTRPAARDAYRFGVFELAPTERRLYRRQRPVQVPPKTFDALLLLVRHADRLVRRDELVRALWPDTYVTEANLTNIIVNVRKILGRNAIQTVSKFGYRFAMPVLGEPGIDPETYAIFVRAKELFEARSLEPMSRARDLLSLCVARDPTFAMAWAWLGRACRLLEKLFNQDAAVNLELAQAALRRALTIDPNLACAHHFYTHLQADLGQARDAMVRLACRVAQRGHEAESLAGLVQVCRFCGLLDESVAAHALTKALDPTITTGVSHTHFLRGEYAASLATYSTGARYYLDAAALAALGETRRATALLRERLAAAPSPMMYGLMGSLHAILEGRRAEALKMMTDMEIAREPEVLFYLARHFAMAGAAAQSVQMLRRARVEGFTSSRTVEHDEAFVNLKNRPPFRVELHKARAREADSRRALEQAGGARIRVLAPSSVTSPR